MRPQARRFRESRSAPHCPTTILMVRARRSCSASDPGCSKRAINEKHSHALSRDPNAPRACRRNRDRASLQGTRRSTSSAGGSSDARTTMSIGTSAGLSSAREYDAASQPPRQKSSHPPPQGGHCAEKPVYSSERMRRICSRFRHPSM